jgi:hypothetical protein
MALVGLVFDVRDGYRKDLRIVPDRAAFRDIGVALYLRLAFLRLRGKYRGRKSGLAVVYVADSTYVDMRLIPYKRFLCHDLLPRLSDLKLKNYDVYGIFLPILNFRSFASPEALLSVALHG